MKDRKIDNLRLEDPREALLKLDAETKKNPLYLGKAYETTQPKNILFHQTFEEEQIDFKKNQKKFN
jgi:hypothetical protein